jgi:hypothetical protein
MDALLSTVMMPSGIPVATVAVDGGANAALLALEILAVSDEALAEKDRALSLQLALEALPENFDNPERPVTEAALTALRNAVLYDKGDSGYHPAAEIEVPGLETCKLIDNMLICFSRKTEGFISAYDLASGGQFITPYTLAEEPLNCFFSDSGHAVLVYPDRIVKTTSLESRDGEPLTEDEEEMLAYMLSSGTYGTRKNRVEKQLAQKGRLGYFLSRLTLPYKTMKNVYPILNKIPILYPIFWVYRLIYGFAFNRKTFMYQLKAALTGKT